MAETCTVFYSWQSDLPNRTNRSLIEHALEKAVRAIRDDDSLTVDPAVERDTSGVPGSPDIFDTILTKIEASEAFVCDISIINRRGKRPAPNPNVLIELGYAMKTLGMPRIIMVMNTAYGQPKLLPFDLQKKRVIPYSLSKNDPDTAAARGALAKDLERALRSILIDLPTRSGATGEAAESPQAAVTSALEGQAHDQAGPAADFIDWLIAELDALAPSYQDAPEPDDALVESLAATCDLVGTFAEVASAVARLQAREAALALYSSFDKVLPRYEVPRGFSGSFMSYDFDYFKFIGQELFVCLFAPLVARERWGIIAELLGTGIYCDSTRRDRPTMVSFRELSDYVVLFERRNKRLNLRKVTLHGHLLHERHTSDPLGLVSPMRQFMDADYFLFLRSELEGDVEDDWSNWTPWTALYMDRTPPRFLVEAEYRKKAELLLEPLGLPTLDVLRERLAERVPKLARRIRGDGWPWDPLLGVDPERLGTK